MNTKSLLFGLVGFLLGGLVVSIAATTVSPPSEMSMSQMTSELEKKTGSEYDEAFTAFMIEHHQAAVEMAQLSATRAQHDEIKTLSTDIITAQSKEIDMMHGWQIQWGYSTMRH